jgi:hypothetical protein
MSRQSSKLADCYGEDGESQQRRVVVSRPRKRTVGAGQALEVPSRSQRI